MRQRTFLFELRDEFVDFVSSDTDSHAARGLRVSYEQLLPLCKFTIPFYGVAVVREIVTCSTRRYAVFDKIYSAFKERNLREIDLNTYAGFAGDRSQMSE